MAGKLSWRRTWDSVPDDFTASDPDAGQTVGRIYIRNGQEKLWDWFGQGEIGGRTMGSYRGIEPTKQAAADALEKAWYEFKERMGKEDIP